VHISRSLTASREVILSAGTINSPQLLLLSAQPLGDAQAGTQNAQVQPGGVSPHTIRRGFMRLLRGVRDEEVAGSNPVTADSRTP